MSIHHELLALGYSLITKCEITPLRYSLFTNLSPLATLQTPAGGRRAAGGDKHPQPAAGREQIRAGQTATTHTDTERGQYFTGIYFT